MINKLIEFLLVRVVKNFLNKLPLQGRGTVFGLLVLALTYIGQHLPADYLVYLQQLVDLLVGAGAVKVDGSELAKTLYDIGSFIAAAGILRKSLNADPRG